MVLILLGQSAAGKDAIQKALVKNYGFIPIVSDTTRPIRENEIDGVDYHFIDRKEFESRLEVGKYIECRAYNTIYRGFPDTWYYGCPQGDYADLGKKYIIVLDVDGTAEFKSAVGNENCIVCSVITDDGVREERARLRGSFDKAEWDRRLKDDALKFAPDRVSSVASFEVNNTYTSIDETANNIYCAFSERLEQ